MSSIVVSAPKMLMVHGVKIHSSNKVTNSSLLRTSSHPKIQAFPGLRATISFLGFDSKMNDTITKPTRRIVKAMYTPYTGKVIQVLTEASVDASALKHRAIGTEHILLAFLYISRKGTDDEIAFKVVRCMGISYKAARNVVGYGDRLELICNLSFTDRAKHVLQTATDNALNLGHIKGATTEDLLLALLSESGCVAIQVLETLGFDPEEIRKQVYSMMNSDR